MKEYGLEDFFDKIWEKCAESAENWPLHDIWEKIN